MLAVQGGVTSFEHQGDAVAVRIPPNTQEGATIVVPGEGESALHYKGEPGDLILTITIEEHAYLQVQGADLFLTLPVTMSEAILGAKIPITTPQGSVVMTVPEGVHSGAKLRLKSMGLTQQDKTGDFYVIIQIQSPERIDDAIRQAAKAMDAGYVGNVRDGMT